MHGEQYILDRIFHVAWVPMTLRGKGAQVRRNRVQQPKIRHRITVLAASHEDGPVGVANRWTDRILVGFATAGTLTVWHRVSSEYWRLWSAALTYGHPARLIRQKAPEWLASVV